MTPIDYGLVIAFYEKLKKEVFEYVSTIMPSNGKDGRDGIDGKDGKDGAQGPKGDKGDKGDRGEPGDPGKDGRDGIDGKDGKDGAQGPKGDKGDKGDRGEPGNDGSHGLKGDKGDRGDPGTPGKDGAQGPKGDKGDKGDPGLPGKDGRDGRDGVDGKTPDVQPIIDKITEQYTKLHSAFVAKVNLTLMNLAPGGGSSGGGSARILDNDDVEFKRLSEVSENAILIFDHTKKKFVVRDLLEFIQGIQTGIEVQYNKLIDVEGSFTYIGEAIPGTSTTATSWRIKRVQQVGSDINIVWAEGSADFNKTWDDRASYNYF